ncbi:MAG TPA: phosphatidylglycerol lysyltransferase domain-containing protein [Candidatus Rhabdochlamydia sp.]|jgi:lysylphosphatidylglycerol synthetase-like protein (DUF2156 family)|nr:phosphatidylglycerol lysyltransferase domain-containing protein [Candidatus Rhabdochlamydia sp.]
MDQQVTIDADRLRLIELVRKWAEVNTDGILEKTTQIFSVPHIDGIIGYRIELKNAVVYGDPVCAPIDKIALAKEFENYCQNQNMKVIYIIVSEEFAHVAVEHLSFSLIEFGKKFLLDPFKYVDAKTRLLRKKVRQSSRNGIEIFEYAGNDPQIEQSMEQLATAWVAARRGIQVYLATPTLFADRIGKRWFFAKQGREIIGLALLNELQSHQGWLLNNVMVTKEAPSGVSEHLLVSVLETLEKEQCRSVLIGPVPAKELGKVIGLGQIIVLLASWAFKALKKVCRLDGHEIFWEKFQPELKSSYLLFPKNRFRPSSIIALLRALNITLQ